MPNIKEFIKKIGSETVSLEEQQQALWEIEKSIKEVRQKREEEVGKSAKMVVDALKQIEQRLNNKFQELLATPAMVGAPGKDGKDGKDGKEGLPGPAGINGAPGKDGIDGTDGKDGVSVVDAKIDFDGSLVITLSNGNEIDAGLVIPTAVAEQYNAFMTRGEIIPLQTGNSGKYLTTDGNNLAWDQINISTADITGTLPIANGGTGATTAPTARTNLGLGTIATQNANNVAVTGGAIDGTTIGGSAPAAGTFTTLTATGQTSLGGAAGAEGLRVVTTASAINWVEAAGGASGVSPSVKAAGSQANIGLEISSKGSSSLRLYTNNTAQEQLRIAHTASAVNYVQVTGQVTGASAGVLGGILFTGSDTNVNGAITTKGTGYISFAGNGSTNSQAFRVVTTNAISTGNLIAVQGAAAGSAPSIQAISGPSGTDANIDLNLTTKGTGAIRFNTGNGEAFRVSDIGATSVNYWNAFGRATGASARLLADGGDSVVNGSISSKSTGFLSLVTNNFSQEQLRVTHTASAVNYVQVTGNATGSRPVISSQGSDANIGLNISSKGNRSVSLLTNSVTALEVLAPASGANFFSINGAVAGSSPSIASSGSDTNIDLTLTPKGTGYVQFGTHTATALTISGYIEIKDAGGTIRKLAVVT